MKMSLQDLFDLPFSEIRHNFNVTQQYTWAISTLQARLDHIWTLDDRHSLENIDLRNYISDAIKHFQGNLDELYHMQNSSLREDKVEPQMLDLLNTIA